MGITKKDAVKNKKLHADFFVRFPSELKRRLRLYILCRILALPVVKLCPKGVSLISNYYQDRILCIYVEA